MKIEKKLIFISAVSLFWGLNIVFNKQILKLGVQPITLSFQSYVIGMAVLLTTNIKNLRELKLLSKKEIAIFFMIGVASTLSMILGIYGLKLSTSINYGFLIKSTVVFSTLFAAIFLKENWNKHQAVLIFIFLLGAYIMATQGKRLIPQFGDLLIITASIFISIHSVLLKTVLRRNIKPEIVALSKVISLLILFSIIAPVFDKNFYIPEGGIYLFLTGSFYGLANLFLMKALKIATVSYAAMMTMLAPVIVSVIGNLWLKETFTIFHLFGGGLIIASGIFVQKLKL